MMLKLRPLGQSYQRSTFWRVPESFMNSTEWNWRGQEAGVGSPFRFVVAIEGKWIEESRRSNAKEDMGSIEEEAIVTFQRFALQPWDERVKTR